MGRGEAWDELSRIRPSLLVIAYAEWYSQRPRSCLSPMKVWENHSHEDQGEKATSAIVPPTPLQAVHGEYVVNFRGGLPNQERNPLFDFPPRLA